MSYFSIIILTMVSTISALSSFQSKFDLSTGLGFFKYNTAPKSLYDGVNIDKTIQKNNQSYQTGPSFHISYNIKFIQRKFSYSLNTSITHMSSLYSDLDILTVYYRKYDLRPELEYEIDFKKKGILRLQTMIAFNQRSFSDLNLQHILRNISIGSKVSYQKSRFILSAWSSVGIYNFYFLEIQHKITSPTYDSNVNLFAAELSLTLQNNNQIFFQFTNENLYVKLPIHKEDSRKNFLLKPLEMGSKKIIFRTYLISLGIRSQA